MRHLPLLILACLHGLTLLADTGVPFFRNYTASEYGAHNRNFDVAAGPRGVVFFANCLLKDTHGTIWVGGYHFVARVATGSKRDFILLPVPTSGTKPGEVTALTEENGRIRVLNREGQTFAVKDGTLVPTGRENFRPQAVPTPVKWTVDGIGTMEINHAIALHNGWTALATPRQGLVVLDRNRRKLYALDERDGLCSNSVNKIADDGNGSLWGVTDNGMQGLKGEVTTLARCKGRLYIGTLQGLYVERQEKLHAVKGINHACWKLQVSPDGKTLYAATTEGVYRIDGSTAHRLTREYAQTLCVDGTDLYIAGMDGIHLLSLRNGTCRRISGLSHVMSLTCDPDGHLTAQDLDGKIYRKEKSGTFTHTGTARTDLRFFSGADGGWQWATDMDGKNIACLSTGPGAAQRNEKLKPLGGLTVRALLQEGDSLLWAGGDFGVIRVDFRAADGTYRQTPRLHFRRITIDGDSLLFGGVHGHEGLASGHDGKATPTFGSQTREITFRFSTDAATAQGETTYQYRLEGYEEEWSAWSNQTAKSYANLGFGTYTFQVRAKDAFGRCSDTIAYRFAIERPFYLRWYSLAAYVLLLLLLVWLAVKWRLRGLLKDKQRLEALVASRTEQIRAQKNEIEKKSANLEQALSDLRHAQEDLVRQEKLATVGKLTRGLIDRILNPLNYINNFSHLSYGLVRELRQSLATVKERMGGETYEDADDLLGMLSSNLAKIERHGGNTSRILKAMEEILKEHHRAKERVDLAALCRHSAELVNEYYRDEIARMGITTRFHIPEGSLWIEGNEEQLGKILMSLISNSMYAVAKKYGKQAYAPEISLTLEADGHKARLTLKDNGTGIEPGIIGQVFDPFFTTKTTGEAAGVGLYLSREILLDHGGNITAASVQGEYTEFTITIPII